MLFYALTQTRARKIAHDAFNPDDRRFHLDGEPPINFLLSDAKHNSHEHFNGFHKKSHARFCYKDALIDPTIVYQYACLRLEVSAEELR
jgi:hypothetical protein